MDHRVQNPIPATEKELNSCLLRNDPNRTWAPLEDRLATTTDERHRVVLKAVIEHMKAEAAADLDRLMATLSPTPAYHFWSRGNDVGPKGTDGVRTFYSAFVASRSNVLEYALDRLVLVITAW
ncbi:hypothetical protein [Streptomyces sp. NPDC087538]|uniref:hypothetical protein n=1 Tax=Streptomyces sp. NPDC087538 TaxID=3365797 RepID=UPI00380C34FF